MVVSCSAYGCKRRYNKTSHVKFHRFPLNNPVLLSKWLLAVKRKDFVPTQNSFLCSNHFTDDDYEKSGNIKNWKLKIHSVPSMFDFPAPIQKAFNVPSASQNTRLITDYPVINRRKMSEKRKLEKEEEIEHKVIDYVLNTCNEVSKERAKRKDSDEPQQKKQRKPNEIKRIVGRNTVLLQYISDKMVKVDEELQVMNDFSSNVQWIEDVYNSMNILPLIDECNDALKKIRK